MALIEKGDVVALVDGLKASVEALPEANLGDQLAQLQAEVAAQAAQISSLQSQVDLLNGKVSQAILVLQG
mgnify:CR=1 FL=1